MKKALFCLVAFAAAAVYGREARAEIPLAEAAGWKVSLDGRFNTFISFSMGEPLPNTSGVATWTGFYDFPDSNNNIMKTRIRSGFIQNVLGFTLKKNLSPDTIVTGRFALWAGISATQNKLDNVGTQLGEFIGARELYFKVEGRWGSALAGRNLSLFGRGGILLDYEIEHEYGLGSPCDLNQIRGGSCGHVGFGILFPAFNAGVVYATPEFAGLQLSAGIFDPSIVSERTYTRTPYPRFEGELAFQVPKYFHASVSGHWQRIGQDNVPTQNADSLGVAGSAGFAVGPVQLGVAGFYGQGLGLWAALENYPVFATDTTNLLRKQRGILGLGSLTFGDTKIAGGVGENQVLHADGETLPPPINYPIQQFGWSVGVYQHIQNTIVLAVEYFRATTSWNDASDPVDATKITTPKQTVNFVNVGGTVVF